MLFVAIISAFALPVLFLFVGYGKVTNSGKKNETYTFVGKLISFLLTVCIAFILGYLQASL